MNLQDLHYFVAVAEHKHFGRAAMACHVTQPTLSGQLRKLEHSLGVTLFERNNKRVALTPVGERILIHARRALAEAELVEAVAKTSRDQLAGPLRLGAIPTLAPYLMPLILGPLRTAYPLLAIELWEDLTSPLIELLQNHRLDAALVATEVSQAGLTEISLFVEPFLAVVPPAHPLARLEAVNESDLAPGLLVLADGHCLAAQALDACGRREPLGGFFRAASLETLVNLVEVGQGTTLIPQLAAGTFRGRRVVLRPLASQVSRTIRLATRPTFPRPQALKALEKIIRTAVSPTGLELT